VLEPADGIAFIGKSPGDKSIYLSTGDSGQGMTHGTLAGIILTDLIMGRSNQWVELYDPSRKQTAAMTDWITENISTAAQYADHVKPGTPISELNPGGAIVDREGARRIAIFRDQTGNLHRCSAVCPHAGGIVHWNEAEQSWDCPAHGSRFDRDGKVICGPAKDDLKPA
jgi:Rieske Fe-S protein